MTLKCTRARKSNHCQDGGGVRGYGSLLMLGYLMREVQNLEESGDLVGGEHKSSFDPRAIPSNNYQDDAPGELNAARAPKLGGMQTIPTIPVARSRFIPFKKKYLPGPQKQGLGDLLKPSWNGYYPCHYFDYIGGTSTGG